MEKRMNCRNIFCRSNYYSLLLGLLSIFLLAVCKQTAASHAVIADNAGSATESVGAISATFSVNQQGAATYSIPLNAAPGVNGLNPDLNLSYNSQGNDGLFGHGWSLSGLSAITRCSITREGHRYPVTYGAEDRFCLNNQYLIPVSGEYGEEGTIYHTERESWLRIQAFYQTNGNNCGSGPCYFVATMNHGSQITYGGTDDSRVEAVPGDNVTTIPSGSVRVWTVNQHVDLNKNVIEYHYNEDTTSGEYTPSVILYGGNQTARQQPQRAIELAFDDAASSTIMRYQGGAQVVQSKKINTITSCIADTPIENCSTSPTPQGFSKVATYSLDVAFNAMSQLHYLQSLQLYGADGSSLPATTFNYSAAQSGPLSFEPAVNWTSFFSKNNGWGQSCQARTMADINGDGRFDIIGFGGKYTEFALSEGTPISSPDVLCMAGEKYNSGCSSEDSKYFSCNSGFDANTPRMMGDVNGDGLFDIIGLGGNNIHVAISKGTSFQQQTNWGDFLVKNDGWDPSDLRTMADINGDGLADVIGFGNKTTQFGLSTGTAFTKGPVLRSFFSKDQFSIKDGNPPMLGDVNGDSLIDVVGIKKDQGTRKVYVGLSQGNTFASKVVWNNDLSIDGKPASLQAGRNPIVLLDLNHDRLVDLVFFGDENVYVSLSTGASFSTPTIWNSKNFTYVPDGWDDSSKPGGTLRTFADINGDGKQDLIGFGTKMVQFGINTGSSFIVDSTLFAPITDEFIYKGMGYLQTNPRFPVDMTGDGISDLFGLGSKNAIVAGAPRNQALLTSVVDGLGSL
jgi:hypothetical protein